MSNVSRTPAHEAGSSSGNGEAASAKQAPIVVIGSGLSGYTVIRELRQHDADCPVTLITGDSGEPYYKPSLSNSLAKYQKPGDLIQKSAEDKAAELGITILTHCHVTAIDPTVRVVKTSQGDVAYRKLVLATGAKQRLILPQGADPEWINTVNTLDDYERWYSQLGLDTKKVLLIGAGLIGCEFADDLISRGIGVELVDPAQWPLSRILPEALGVALMWAFAQSGVTLHMGRYVAALERAGEAGFHATLSDGTEIDADLILSAVGLIPETELAASAGLQVNQGVLVDRQMRTSDPHIHALGDCAETGAGVQPYILPLMAQAEVLGRVLAGKKASLAMGSMPVTVKTTSLPLIVCPPPQGALGVWRWQVQGSERDLNAVFYGADDTPLGFALTGGALQEMATLRDSMPPLLAPEDVAEALIEAVEDEAADGVEVDPLDPLTWQQIYVTDRAGVEHVLSAEPGRKIMEIIRDAGLPIEASCGGFCACGTCHCYVNDEWLPVLPPQHDEEIDMLDMAFDVTEGSRLTCQIRYAEELNGLRLTLAPDY